MNFLDKKNKVIGFTVLYVLISAFLILEVRNGLFSNSLFLPKHHLTAQMSLKDLSKSPLIPMGVNDKKEYVLPKRKIEDSTLQKERAGASEIPSLATDARQRKEKIQMPSVTQSFAKEKVRKHREERKKLSSNPLYAPKKMTDSEMEELLKKKGVTLSGRMHSSAQKDSGSSSSSSSEILQKHLPKNEYDKLASDGKNMNPEEVKEILRKYVPESEIKKLSEPKEGRTLMSREDIEAVLKSKLPSDIYEKVMKSYNNPVSGSLSTPEMKYILKQYLPKETYKSILFSIRSQGRPATDKELEYLKKNNIPVNSIDSDED